MNFLAPTMLVGLAALVVPVVLHVMNRVRVRTTDWGAMRFLRKSMRQNRSRVRVQDLLLLLMRCGMVLAAVLAFARLVWMGSMEVGQGVEGPVAAVVVLDHSASMGVFEGSVTRFELAKRAVGEWLDGRGAGSVVALQVVSNRTQSLMVQPTPDVGMVRGMLEKVELSERGVDMVEGLRLACEVLREVEGLPREVHVFSDGQAFGWEKEEVLRRLGQEFAEVRVVPHWIGDEGVGNVAVTGLRVEGGMVVEGQVCRLVVEVGNFSDEVVKGLRVGLKLNGDEVEVRVLDEVVAGGRREVVFSVLMPGVGLHEVTAEIGVDAMPLDNRRSLVVEVLERKVVLLVEDDRERAVMEREGYFLANALVPTVREDVEKHYLGVEFVSSAVLADELRREDGQGVEVVFLCDVGVLSEVVVDALAEYVWAGGKVVVFPGEKTVVEEWRESARFWQMLPAELGEVVERERPMAWKSVGLGHPVTKMWNDEEQGSLGGVRFRKYYPLQPKEGARVVSELEDGTASVVEGWYGAGQVVMFGSTATPEWNQLPLHPAFVPYLQRLMGYLSRAEAGRRELLPGEVFRLLLKEEWLGKRMRVRTPDGNEWGVPGAVKLEGGEGVLRFGDTEKVGVYRMIGGEGEGQLLGMFAVQMEAGESDLRRVEEKWVTEVWEGEMVGMVLGVKMDFWTWLMWVVVGLFVLEGVLSFWLSRRAVVKV